jgi:hypothetical protein
MDSMEATMDIEMSAPSIVPNKVHVFGVTHISTKEIQNFVNSVFSVPGTTPEFKVEWIDDDSCNIAFKEIEHSDQLLSLGTPIEGSIENAVSFSVPPLHEGEEAQMLAMRRAHEGDTKNPARSWRDSKFYKKRLEEKGINPETLAPINKVILKPREGAKVPESKPVKVSLIPRALANKARAAMYGDEFSRRKPEKKKPSVLGSDMVLDEDELRRREERSRRFASHS